jgi:2-isopropylmalate synthase
MHPLVVGGSRIRLEYSPESFTSTELDFALEICEAVTDSWQPSLDNKIILNLPATVEYATPNIHADQIEWMSTHLTRRDLTTLSLHTHNDRGTGTAATELGLLAGADRVEGTLFGVGERTGNLDIVTVALNFYTHGIHPGLDLSRINVIREVYERCTRMEVHPRHPYAGDLAFTAFSGSHQDAIKKSWEHQGAEKPWDVLYIPIDPADIGRSYKAIIRINSQSGKGGVAYVLEKEFGYQLPKLLQKELGRLVNDLSDQKGTELTAEDVHELFLESFLIRNGAVALEAFRAIDRSELVTYEADLRLQGSPVTVRGSGNGPIDAFVQALAGTDLPVIEILNYSEHSLGAGAGARAISYIQIKVSTGRTFYGVGSDTNIELASIHAIISALNRAIA